MSGIVPIAEGEEIPLVLTLPDGATDKYPQASIYNDAGILIGTVNLTHVANGLYVYQGAPVLMPDQPFVAAVFIVYSDAGHLTVSNRYAQATEVFAVLRTPTEVDVAAIKAKTDQLVFTKPNELDVNVQSQNNAEVYGSGVSNDLWRGYP